MREQAHDAVGQAGALNVLGVLEFRQRRYMPRATPSASLKLALEAKKRILGSRSALLVG